MSYIVGPHFVKNFSGFFRLYLLLVRQQKMAYKLLKLSKVDFLKLIPDHIRSQVQYIKSGGDTIEKTYVLKHCGIIDCLNKNCTTCAYALATWAKKVKERDNFTCKNCGNKYNLVSHHLLQRINFPEQAFDLDNGITLCATCHHKAHAARKSI